MDNPMDVINKIKPYGVGRRKLDDEIFANDKRPVRLGIYDTDDENLCHEVVKTSCNIPSCKFTAESLIEFEAHYNSTHRYACGQCKKMLPSPHLLDLHLQETHDSFFAVMAERKPSYSCYIEECNEKFMTANERHHHCVKVHKLPKDFRFEQKAKNRKKASKTSEDSEVENKTGSKEENKVIFFNSKQKAFPKYTGKKFVKSNERKTRVEMDITVGELKESLPQ